METLKQHIRSYLNKPGLGLAVALFIGLIIYLPSLGYQPVGDDFDFIYNWQAKNQADIPALLAGDLPEAHQGNYRPIRSLAYWLMDQLFSDYIPAYQALGIGLHLTVTVLIWYLVSQLFNQKRLADLSAIFFASHPIHVEAITFITASFDVLGYIWLLLAFLVWLKRPHQYWLIFSLSLLAYLSNEITYVLPGLIGWYLLVETAGSGLSYNQIKTWGKQLAPTVASLVSVLVVRFLILDLGNRTPYLGEAWWHHFWVSLKSWLWYWKYLIWPDQLGLIHQLPGGLDSFTFNDLLSQQAANQTLLDPSIGLTVILLVIMSLAVGWLWRRKLTIPVTAWGWLNLSLLPVVNLIPVALIYSDRYAYLASLGFCLLLAWIIIQLSRYQPQLAILLTALIVSAYSWQTLNYNQVWRNESIYWDYNLEMGQDNFLVWFMRAQIYQKNQDLESAIEAYQHSFKLQPDYSKTAHNLGLIYYHRENWADAVDWFLRAEQITPGVGSQISAASALYQWSIQLSNQGETELAQEKIELASQLDPANPKYRLDASQ